MKNWEPVDFVTGLIAVTVCAVVLLCTLGPVITGRPLTQENAEMLQMMVLTLIALVSVYIGKRL